VAAPRRRCFLGHAAVAAAWQWAVQWGKGAVLVFKHVYLHRGQKSLVLTKRLTAARRRRRLWRGDGVDADVAVVADLFSYKAVDKSSTPLHRLPAVYLADAVFTPNQLLFIIIDFYDYWCRRRSPRCAPPRLVVGGGKQSKLRGVDFAPMQ
jgi:hypothetical protein